MKLNSIKTQLHKKIEKVLLALLVDLRSKLIIIIIKQTYKTHVGYYSF